MQEWQILHNSKCSKSRQTLEILKSAGITPEIIDYQTTPLSNNQLVALSKKLSLEPSQFVRKKDDLFRELQLMKSNSEELVSAIAANPSLLERPIVIRGNRAIIGRPPENVRELL